MAAHASTEAGLSRATHARDAAAAPRGELVGRREARRVAEGVPEQVRVRVRERRDHHADAVRARPDDFQRVPDLVEDAPEAPGRLRAAEARVGAAGEVRQPVR